MQISSSSFQKSFLNDQSFSNKKFDSEKISMNNENDSLLIKSSDSQNFYSEPIQIE